MFDFLSALLGGAQAAPANRLQQPIAGQPVGLPLSHSDAPPLPPPTTVNAPPKVAGVQPQPAAIPGSLAPVMPQGAPAAQPQEKTFGQKYREFWDSDRGQALGDMLNGWAMGRTPQESLSMGAAMMAQNKGQRRDKNETIAWLQRKGMDADTAKQLAASPKSLQEYLTNMLKPQTPDRKFQTLPNGDYGYFEENKGTFTTLGSAPKPTDDPSGRPTELQRDLAAAGLKPGTPEWNEAILSKLRPKGMVVESDGNGGFKLVQGADVSGGANLNVEQGKNTGFLLRAQDANKVIDQFQKEGTNSWNKLAEALPLGMGNHLISNEAQQLDQAKRDFINSVLRQESGAVISDNEFTNAEKQYFPQPGDSKETIAQKSKNRANAIQGFKIRSGPGAAAVDKLTSAPEVGAVQDGYRFKGGNPADPNSWEQVR